jgi:hypothetical protein
VGHRLGHNPKYTRHAVYVLRNIEARSCNFCCSGKAISITYSGWVFVALVIQHAMRVRHIVICSLPGFTVSYKRHDFRKQKEVTRRVMCVVFFSTTFICSISHSKKNSARDDCKCAQGLVESTPLFLSDLNETLISR